MARIFIFGINFYLITSVILLIAYLISKVVEITPEFKIKECVFWPLYVTKFIRSLMK